MTQPLLLTGVELAGPAPGAPTTAPADVRIEDGRIVAIGRDLPHAGARVVRAWGAALLPGLHDHHLHLLAMAAARRSLDVNDLSTPEAFDRAVGSAHRALPPDRWLRIVGAHDAHGPLGPERLEALAPGRRTRAQHRSGAAWVLSPAGLASIGSEPGGWIHGADAALGRRWGDEAPDLAGVGADLAAMGVTGATDATPYDDLGAWRLLAAARADGSLPQRVVATGGLALAEATPPDGLALGPVKVVVADHALPPIDELAGAIRRAHRAGRPVAVHCVTRVGLVVALAAWEEVGALAGDRIEHGSVLPVELVPTVADLGLTVVTQPAFLRARGDDYLAQVEPDDLPHLYRCGSLVAAGVPVGLSTDAPFGPADPWLAVAAAADRRTGTGATVGGAEALPAALALARLLTPPEAPGGAPRRVAVGAPADLVLLDRPPAAALADPGRHVVRATWIGGALAHGDEAG
ncbi:MAG: amidohydrolase family protein [Acidimicrobiales bacterium]